MKLGIGGWQNRVGATVPRSERARTSTVTTRATDEAGLELFGTMGIAGVGVGEVCVEAGLTKRYSTKSFTSLDELVDAVVERAVARFTAAVLPEIISHGWRDPRPIVRAGMTALQDDPRLTRLLVVETRGNRRSAATTAQIDDPDKPLWGKPTIVLPALLGDR
jgi:AcrR family transcriptional regulator